MFLDVEKKILRLSFSFGDNLGTLFPALREFTGKFVKSMQSATA
jgi:hypothetical protein